MYTISIGDPPTITEPPQSTIQVRGANFTFRCTASGDGGLTLTWRTPLGAVIDTGQQELSRLTHSSTLTISNITVADGGSYICIAANEAGESEASAVLYVQPYITEQPVDLLATNGSSGSITCMAEAFPAPMLHWERLNEMVYEISGSGSGVNSGSGIETSPLELMMQYDTVSEGGVLEFDPVLFGDEGVYRCVASIHVGSETIADAVTVSGELSARVGSP